MTSEEINDFVMEKRYIHKNGGTLCANLFIAALKDHTDTIVRFLVMVEDITERKEMEKLVTQRTDKLANINKMLNVEIEDHENAEIIKKLKISNEELEQFAYVSSHDLREPLRMITGFLQLLERRYHDKLDEDANEFIGFAVDGAKRLDAMINDILIFSRVSNKERNLIPVNFNKVIEKTYLNLKISIEETNAEITNDPLPTFITDEN